MKNDNHVVSKNSTQEAIFVDCRPKEKVIETLFRIEAS